MNLEQQVTSLELSKRLKELNLKQESLFCWSEINEFNKIYYRGNPAFYDPKDYSAYTVAELGEMLPAMVNNKILTIIKYIEDDYFTSYDYISSGDHEESFYVQTESNEANARAKMLIHLIENNLVTSDWRAQWLEK